MELETDFPLRLYMNLGTRGQRRADLECRLMMNGLTATRQPAVDARWLRQPYGYRDVLRRAKALTKRLCLRRAEHRKVPAVLIFEDDVDFHPEWRSRLETLQLPEDWGIFMLGGHHAQRPEIAGPNLVRVTHAVDNHAWAVRAKYFPVIRKALRGRKTLPSGSLRFSDQIVAALQQDIPTYAPWPNLAWQAAEYGSDHYDAEGNQIKRPEQVAGLQAEMNAWCRERGLRSWEDSLQTKKTDE